MYQHIWYNKNNNTDTIFVSETKPKGWISELNIDRIMLTCWCEHCLECAVPLCYNNCENWVKRIDQKCQKTFYGTKYVEIQGQKGALLKFRKWGKIEACINLGCVSIKAYKRVYALNRAAEIIAMTLSKAIKILSPTLKFCGAQHIYRDKVFKLVRSRIYCNFFLFQCYSPSDREYNFMIEFYSPNETFYRNGVTIHKGFNQSILDLSNVDLRINEKTRVRLYPENNITEDIILFYSDFVVLKEEKMNIDTTPSKKVKCVAWDLDKTLWDGILIESTEKSLKLRPHVIELMESLDKRGIIQIVISKNDLSDVEPELKRLGVYDYFVYVFANWNAKSENLKAAAKLININVNTFALIDDSKYERGEVSENVPCVRLYDEIQLESLLSKDEFNVEITADGSNRRKMYQTEVKRKTLEAKFEGTNIDFLKSCQLMMIIQPISDESFLRSYELVQRTNQLNLSGIRYDIETFHDICFNSNRHSFVLTCSDKYGEYGQVGFANLEVTDSSVVIKEYAMSCRVAGKWLEPQFIKWLSDKYNKETIVFVGIDSKKNGLLIRTLKQFGIENKSTDPTKLHLSISREKMNWADVVEISEPKL